MTNTKISEKHDNMHCIKKNYEPINSMLSMIYLDDFLTLQDVRLELL